MRVVLESLLPWGDYIWKLYHSYKYGSISWSFKVIASATLYRTDCVCVKECIVTKFAWPRSKADNSRCDGGQD